MALTVTTNGHVRPLLEAHELPAQVQKDLGLTEGNAEEFGQYVKAYGQFWAISDFVTLTHGERFQAFGHHVIDPESPLVGWDGICSQSAFHAIVLRWATEGYEHDPYGYVVVGWAQELS